MSDRAPVTRSQRAEQSLTEEEKTVLAKAGLLASSGTKSTQPSFEGLGKSGVSDIGGKIETFEAPSGLSYVELVSDEFTSLCPVTGQPDFCTVTVKYEPNRLCAESKSVKLYFQSFREEGAFCEQLACTIADHFQDYLQAKSLLVEVVQKSRGGITLTAQAARALPESNQ